MTIKELFSGHNIYEIPKFQREFSWKDENFDDFFKDLFKSSGISISNTNSSPLNKYFFGMILLLGDKSAPDIDNPFQVIDGQQRLTTMTLFFAAIIETIKEHNEEYSTDYRDRLFCTVTKQGKKEERHRLVNDQLDPFLPISVLDYRGQKSAELAPQAESQAEKHLLESFNYFKELLAKENIAELLKVSIQELETSIYLDILDALGKHLGNSTLISIYHNDRTEAQTLFSNLNYRGLHLSQTDLIKNELFSILEDKTKRASSQWEKIKKNLESSGETLEKFMFHYLSSRYPNVKKSNLFPVFIQNIERTEESYLRFINSLKFSSDYYKIILLPEDKDIVFDEASYFKKKDRPALKRNLEFLNQIKLAQYRNLLITLFECRHNDIIEDKELKQIIDFICKHQCLHILAKSPSNNLTSVYSRASRDINALMLEIHGETSTSELDTMKEQVKKVLEEFKNKLKDKMPDLTIVKKANPVYEGASLGNKQNKASKELALIKFILGKLSEHEQPKELSPSKSNDALGFIYAATLEHIINKREEVDNRYSLGNLILLEADQHTDKEDLEGKKEMYAPSKISMTRQFFIENPDFSADQILGRKDQLLEKYYELVKES